MPDYSKVIRELIDRAVDQEVIQIISDKLQAELIANNYIAIERLKKKWGFETQYEVIKKLIFLYMKSSYSI